MVYLLFRPAVVISYSVAAGSALLSGLCYTEFVVDLPAAGGAFNYISVVFGEFTAWCAASWLSLIYQMVSFLYRVQQSL